MSIICQIKVTFHFILIKNYVDPYLLRAFIDLIVGEPAASRNPDMVFRFIRASWTPGKHDAHTKEDQKSEIFNSKQ